MLDHLRNKNQTKGHFLTQAFCRVDLERKRSEKIRVRDVCHMFRL
jgi:hypothetical protein